VGHRPLSGFQSRALIGLQTPESTLQSDFGVEGAWKQNAWSVAPGTARRLFLGVALQPTKSLSFRGELSRFLNAPNPWMLQASFRARLGKR
jgi:hypothetical protein